MKITRLSDTDYEVVTDTVMSDGRMLSDGACRLVGSDLRSYEDGKTYRVGGLLRVALGPAALPRVLALAVGESAEFSH